MKELDIIISAYRAAHIRGERCLIATLVKVEGSSYRNVGARMLLSSGGERSGSISGGCLESEVQKKAWWLTEQGPVLQQYRTTSEEETGVPFGLGCSGTLHILLKRVDERTSDLLEQLAWQRIEHIASSLATVLSGPELGLQRLFPGREDANIPTLQSNAVDHLLSEVAAQTTFEYAKVNGIELLLEALPPRQRLVVFGAGDDAKPLVSFARLLGWDVTVADGRAHLATALRFPDATSVITTTADELSSRCPVREDDAVVIMTHSYEQDRNLLEAFLQTPVRYLGLLGPRYRTKRLMEGMVGEASLRARLHSPIGLNIGVHTPETIALAIVAEIQSVLSKLETASGVQKSGIAKAPSNWQDLDIA